MHCPNPNCREPNLPLKVQENNLSTVTSQPVVAVCCHYCNHILGLIQKPNLSNISAVIQSLINAFSSSNELLKQLANNEIINQNEVKTVSEKIEKDLKESANTLKHILDYSNYKFDRDE